MAKQTENAAKLQARIDSIMKGDQPTYDKMERFFKRYKGEWWNKDLDENESKIFANYIFATVESIAPLLTDNRPIWSIRARQSFVQNYIEAYSVALEYAWDKFQMDNKLFLWVKDALIMKIGLLKVRWDRAEDDIVIDNVDPRTFFIAPGYKRLDEAPMCGERMEKPLSWVRFKYPDKFKEVIKSMGQEELANLQDWELEEHKEKVYEVWMRDNSVEEYFLNEKGEETKEKTDNKKSRKLFPNGKIVVTVRGVLLEEKASPFQHGGPPYVELYDYTVPHEFWGMSEADQIEEINLSFNRGLQLMHRWMVSYGDPPWIVDPNSGLDVEDVKKQLKTGGAVLEAMATANQPALDKVSADPINQTVPLLMNGNQALIEEITGVTDVSKGQVGKSQRQSATEISTLFESANTRTRQRVRNYEQSLSKLLTLIISMQQQFYTDLKEFQIRTETGLQRGTISNQNSFALAAVSARDGLESEDEEAQIDRDIQAFIKMFGKTDPVYAAFDVTVDTNSTLPMDKQSKANMFLRLLELAAGDPTKSMAMWKATLEALRLPKHRQIIEEMQQMEQQAMQAQQQGPPGPAIQGPPEVGELLREAQ